jgi:predicted PurR-regulated permease PerM
MHPNLEKPFTFDRVIRLIIGALVILALFFIINKISGALVPFFIAWLIAYLLHPLVDFMQRKIRIRNRVLAIMTSLVLVITVIAAIVTLLITPVSNEISNMSDLLKEYANSDHSTLIIPENIEEYMKKIASLPELQHYLENQDFGKLIEQVIPQLWKIVAGSLNAVASVFVVFIILLYVIFILLDYETITEGWLKLLPEKYRTFIDKLTNDLEEGMNRYFRGQFLIAFTVGVLFSIGFAIVGLPLGILFGIFVGVLNLVPYLQIISILPASMLVVLQSLETGQPLWIPAISVLAVYVIIQTFQDGYLVPKIMGKRMGLNPAVILLSLSIWGALLGIAGMIIALPFTTLIVSYYRRLVLFEDEKGQALAEELGKTDTETDKNEKIV